MDLWQKARNFAEEAAKRSQEITKEAAKKSQELTRGAPKFSDILSETAKKSKEFAAEAAKKADQIKIDTFKRADQLKSLAERISPQIPAATLSLLDSSSAMYSSSDLEKFGITDDLIEFVQGIAPSTFTDFPIKNEPEMSDVPMVGNVRKDLTEWQERHATLVLSAVKEISRLRYELCPRVMKERKFWRIYFIIMNSHVAPYEKRYMEEIKLNEVELVKDVERRETSSVGTTSEPEVKEIIQQSKNSGSSSAVEDLDEFLLGDLGSSDEDPGNDDEGFDDDFEIADNLEDEDEKQL